jgi:hypothetical protein
VLAFIDVPAGVGQQKIIPDPQRNVFKPDDGLVFQVVLHEILF